MVPDWPIQGVDDVRRAASDGLATGPFGSSVSAKFFRNEGVPLVRGSNLSQDVGHRLVEDEYVFVSEEKAAEFPRAIAGRGDLIFTCWGTIGQVGLVDARSRFSCYLVSNKQMKLSPDPAKADSLFLYYLFSSPAMQAAVRNMGIGSSVPGFNLGNLRDLRFPLPPLREQHAIAHTLGALDDKIEQNRRTARLLERLARAIFRAWFVDFEPVEAKQAGAASFRSMPQEVFEELPTRFTDSELGPIPEGWEVKPIASIATFLNGLALQKYPPRGDGEDLRVIKIAQLRKGSTEGADWANSDVPEQYVIEDRDLLFSWSGTLEVEFWFGGKGALNQHLFKVTSSRYPSWYCLLWVRQHLPWFRAIAASKATTMGHIKRGHLEETKVVVPHASVLRVADASIGAFYDLLARVMVESRKLIVMRDLLLPKLLSREMRVRVEGGSNGES